MLLCIYNEGMLLKIMHVCQLYRRPGVVLVGLIVSEKIQFL